MSYKTEQENFWATEFGDDYIQRNTVADNLASRIHLFSNILRKTFGINEILELGANIGNNLHALHMLLPKAKIKALEINQSAVAELQKLSWINHIYKGSILEERISNAADLSFTSGVLIHINPDSLSSAYRLLYESSRRYVMVCEYYNPAPVEVNYRGHSGKLFKRDFAGEIMKAYPDLHLIDYAFNYRGDPNFPMDDLTWFLMEKK
jgi:pseudaminic acid biosynthesis-associated methylase